MLIFRACYNNIKNQEVIDLLLHEKLKKLRENMTPPTSQTQLGHILNISQKAISRLETGAAQPTPEDLIKYCKLYHVSADYLLGLPEDMPYPKRK